jgi:hypothetical protein
VFKETNKEDYRESLENLLISDGWALVSQGISFPYVMYGAGGR